MTRTIARMQPAVDPAAERAEFFANLEILELTMVIPQASPAQAVARY
jgi:hypothetical protein